MEFMDT